MSRLSPARRALLWWFRSPSNAHMSASIAVDFSESRRYLKALEERGIRVSVHQLLVLTVARVLREFPAANARVYGGNIVRKSEVGVAMPVNLVGHPGEARSELTMSVLPAVDRLNLQELSARTSRDLKEAREGKADHPFTDLLFRFAERAPGPLFDRTLDWMDRLSSSPLGPRLFSLMPITTAVTNPGSAFGNTPGVWFRAGGVSLPQKLVSVGTLWGFSAVQEEVVPVEGKAEVRPVLPVVLAFDHRLFDGVMAGKILLRFAQILQAPQNYFGQNGETPPGAGL